MPVKLREAKTRRPVFTDEVLSLFRELEAWPPRRRRQQEYIAKSKRLAALLDLTSEWWTMNHVHNTDPPCGPKEGVARVDWVTCREMRERLLEATRPQRNEPADQPEKLV